MYEFPDHVTCAHTFPSELEPNIHATCGCPPQVVVLIHVDEVRAACPDGSAGRVVDEVAIAEAVDENAEPALPKASATAVSEDAGPEIA